MLIHAIMSDGITSLFTAALPYHSFCPLQCLFVSVCEHIIELVPYLSGLARLSASVIS